MNNPLNFLLHPQHDGKVKFLVTGSASDYNVTYKGTDNDVHQLDHVGKNWKYSFKAREGDYVYIAAQANEAGKNVEIRIVYQGKIFRQSKNNGDFALAHAGGCLC